MFKTLVKDGRDVLLGVMQEFFQNHSEVPDKFRWDPDPELTKVWISDRSPDEMRRLPAIVTRAGAGRNMKTGFKHFAERVADNGDEFRRFSGKWHLPFFFIVASLSTKERDELIDLVIMCLEVHCYDQLLCNAVEMEPETMAVSGDETVFIDPTTPIERITASAMFFLEWFHDVLLTEPVVGSIKYEPTIELKHPPITR